MKRLGIAILVWCAGAGVAIGEGDATAGKSKAAACAACHGADGNSANPAWPKLAGQHAAYILAQLRDFKSGARQNGTMSAMAAPLSEQDMEDLAAYFAGQSRSVGSADESKVVVGESIYRGGDRERGIPACMACHGPRGEGNPAAHFPVLGGQHAAYVGKILRDFRTGPRHNDPVRMMRTISAKLTDGEIDAVASYVSGLH